MQEEPRRDGFYFMHDGSGLWVAYLLKYVHKLNYNERKVDVIARDLI